MNRRQYLKTAGIAATGVALAGCAGNGSEDGTDTAETGILEARVSDQPQDIGDFERLVVTIHEIRIGPRRGADEDEDADADAEDDTDEADETDETEEGSVALLGNHDEDEDDGGMGDDGDADDEDADDHEEQGDPDRERVIEVDDVEADLVQLQGDASQFVDEAELETGTYNYLKLSIRDEVDAALEDGGEAEVMTPGNAPLMFNEAFDIRANTRTRFTADFAPVRQGQTGRYLLRPVPDEIRIEYEEEGADDEETDDEDADDESDSDDE
ncbi:MAG: DUF4382 domain-containing protein [Natronomonas sp.]